MSWALKPKLPTGSTFSGEMVYNSVDIEIPATFLEYVESVSHSIKSQYVNKYTGFETKKYSLHDTTEQYFSIMMVGSLPRWLRDSLHVLAIAMNGPGMILQFDDTWITTSSSTIYDCRWINAGDFVDNSELLNGASIDLIAYNSSGISINIFQKIIATVDLEWTAQINEAGADNIYYRAI